MSFLSKCIVEFQEEYPQVRFEIYSAIADDIKEKLEKGTLDIGLLCEPVDIARYDFIRMPFKERWGVLVRKDSKIAHKSTVTPKDLSGLPLLMAKRELVRSELASWFGDYYQNLDVLFISNLSTNGAVMVNQGLAYSLVIEGAVPFWDSSKVIYRPLCPQLYATSVLAWKRGQPFSMAATKFIEHSKCFLGKNKA